MAVYEELQGQIGYVKHINDIILGDSVGYECEDIRLVKTRQILRWNIPLTPFSKPYLLHIVLMT